MKRHSIVCHILFAVFIVGTVLPGSANASAHFKREGGAVIGQQIKKHHTGKADAIVRTSLLSVNGGALKKEEEIQKKSSKLLNAKLIFRFMALGTATFAIPSIVAPEFTHKLLAKGPFPSGDTYYYYMFALRECYLAAAFYVASTMPESQAKAWQPWGIFVLITHTIMNICHTGWNPVFQPLITAIHGTILLWNLISYLS